MNPQKRSLAVMALVIILMIVNFTRLSGSECIRPIHIVTLITLGAALGIMLVNIIYLIKKRNS